MERLLILNPGSTSTKLAVFDGEEPLFVESITHSAEELAPFDCVADQYEFRRELVLDCLKEGKKHGFGVLQFNAVVATNLHARHLYGRLGFIQLGTIPKGFRMKDGHYEDICPYYKEL